LRFGTIYHELIEVVEHPVSAPGLVCDDGRFKIEAVFLDHGVDNIGWRITEPDTRKFKKESLDAYGIQGEMVSLLHQKGSLLIDGRKVTLDDVSYIRPGDCIAVVIDTRVCRQAIEIARNARIFLCESTYLESERDLAYDHYHLTAKQAAEIARAANAKQLILTHFSARYLNLKAFEAEAKPIFPNTFVAEDLMVFPFPKNPTC
jgi:ribonuclease Z